MKKHKLYKLYAQANYDHVARLLKKSGHNTLTKELSKFTCFELPTFIEKHGSLFVSTLFPSNPVDLLIFATEYLWATSARTVIYPRSASEINVISKSTFKGLDISLTAGEMMVVASPPDSDLPPLMAGCIYKSQTEKFNSFYGSLVTLPYEAFDLQGNVFVVVFQDPDSGNVFTNEVSEKDIDAYASASTWQEIYGFLEKSGKVSAAGHITEEEQVLQAKVIKAALNFWLYKLSSPTSFISQTPPVHAREAFGAKPTSSFSLSFADRFGSSKTGTISEVGIHMRNLRDERYYTSDEWKDKPRGSRWIEVGPYTRGGKGVMIEDEGDISIIP